MTAEARELIDGQYADRPHLRPVLDAVLAALPGLTCRPEPGGPGHHNIHVALTGPGKDRRGMAGPGEDGPRLVVPGRPGAGVRASAHDARGNPVCARLRPPAITWSAGPGQASGGAGPG